MSSVLVVGAGQLGLMMAAAGARFGIAVDRVDHKSGEVLPGTSNIRVTISREKIASHYPLITAELEHLLGNELVESLSEESAWLNKEAMSLLPARDQQKALLDQLEVATSPWQAIANPAELEATCIKLGDDLIVKSIRDGYDGKGQWVVSEESEGDIPKAAFGNIIAEKKIDFHRELSLVGARRRDGSCSFYPLVENYHQHGMLRYTIAPAALAGDLQAEAEAMLEKIMHSLGYVGVMAMECFDSEHGLLVNELAPRVHNSGHWTQLGADYSQFDMHLFAITGRPFGPPRRIAARTVMLNLIGCEFNPDWYALPGIQCWWYGKSWRENRKLGHINISAPSKQKLADLCRELSPTLDSFHQQMLGLCLERLDQTG